MNIRRLIPALAVLAVLLLSDFAPTPSATIDLAKCHGYGGYAYHGHC